MKKPKKAPTPLRSRFGFGIAVLVVFGALLGALQKPSQHRTDRVCTTVPSDRSELRCDLAQQNATLSKLLPARTEDALAIPDSGGECENLSLISVSRNSSTILFSLYQRPPPA